MITVVNKYKHTPTAYDVYIGRGSPVGNPYSHMVGTTAKYHVASREEAIEKYREWIEYEYDRNPKTKEFIDGLVEKLINKIDVNLVCFCHPKPCHGNVLVEIVHFIAREKFNYGKSISL